jgi:hypothetical protein
MYLFNDSVYWRTPSSKRHAWHGIILNKRNQKNEAVMANSFQFDSYLQGLEYEIVSERITNEVAHHTTQLYALGKDTVIGSLHYDAILSLENLRESLDPDDARSLGMVSLTLDAMRADREQVFALTQNASTPTRRTAGRPTALAKPAIA